MGGRHGRHRRPQAGHARWTGAGLLQRRRRSRTRSTGRDRGRAQPDARPEGEGRRRGAAPVKDFNLSDWALDHRSMVWYFMLVFMIAGVFSYLSLGREEDPAFTIKTMVIQANWPGASVNETITQVTDRIEKKLEELDSLDYTRSITTPGKAVVFVNLKPSTPARAVTP